MMCMENPVLISKNKHAALALGDSLRRRGRRRFSYKSESKRLLWITPEVYFYLIKRRVRGNEAVRW
jgi:hypothetical protein